MTPAERETLAEREAQHLEPRIRNPRVLAKVAALVNDSAPVVVAGRDASDPQEVRSA